MITGRATLWVVSGAGRRVGKSHLALALRAVLPAAVYAKRGHGQQKAGKPPEFFHDDASLSAFVEQASRTCQHVVLESNAWAAKGIGDVIFFLEPVPPGATPRDDADLLRTNAHIHVAPGQDPENARAILGASLPDVGLCDQVLALLKDQQAFLQRQVAGPPPPPLATVTAQRFDGEAPHGRLEQCEVATEAAVTLHCHGRPTTVLMATPQDLRALILGHLFSEGLFPRAGDLPELTASPGDPLIFHVTLSADTRQNPAVTRRTIGTSGAQAWSTSEPDDRPAPPPLGDTLRIPASALPARAAMLQKNQPIFSRTGGTHAVALMDAAGTLYSLAEDLGRHNAMDKAIGLCLLAGRNPAGLMAMLSGRVSAEMVAKCVNAGIELLAAVSAPSSLALALAEAQGLTVCGFVRGTRATVFTHPQRVL